MRKALSLALCFGQQYAHVLQSLRQTKSILIQFLQSDGSQKSDRKDKAFYFEAVHSPNGPSLLWKGLLLFYSEA